MKSKTKLTKRNLIKKWLVTLEPDFKNYYRNGGQYPSPEIDYDEWIASNPGANVMPNMVIFHELSKKYFDKIPVHHGFVSTYGRTVGGREWFYRWGGYKGNYNSIMELEGVRDLQTNLCSLYKSLYEYKFISRKINFARALRSRLMIDDLIIEMSEVFRNKTEFDFMSYRDLVVLFNKIKFVYSFVIPLPPTKPDIIK